MALSAAAAAALKKIAATAATDKKVGKTVLGIIGVVLVALVTPILAIIAIFQGGAQLDFTALKAQAHSEQLANFEQVMLAIEDEIDAQGLSIDPLRAQIIFLCALQGREKEDDFYTKYISCFADGQDVFLGVSEAFGVTFSAEEIEKIERLVGMAREAQTGPSNGVHNRIVALTANDETPLPEGAFSSPLHGQDWKPLVSSGFGMRIHPISGERKFHSGLDLSLPEGTKIYAAQAGKVLIVGNDSDGYGRYCVLYHGGGIATLYAHCSKILVSEGQAVTTETVIARSGNTGATTGAHLHYEVVEQGKPVSPTKYLRG